MRRTDAIPIESLVAHGFSRRVVDLWHAHGYRELLPIQSRALAEYGVLRNRNLVVFAPTSSGKTFVAELAAVHHLEQGRKVAYLVPTKALAEEKARQWIDLYGQMGLRVVVSTRERPESDPLVLAGRFDVLLAVYEKMKSFLVVQPEILGQVRLVVIDELQMLADPQRGGSLELVLLKLIGAPAPPQIIALSAVLADAPRLSDWMRSELLLARERPVELREGVFNCEDGVFHYTCFNSKEEGREALAPGGLEPQDTEETGGPAAFHELARRLAGDLDEQVLVFVPTRASSRQWAYQMANRVDFDPVDPALEELEWFEPSHARDLMIECLRRGVAYHNAELSWELRRLVEQYYNAGAIRILFSTSTLGQGVNLSGRNVLHVGEMVTTDKWTGQATFVPLARDRFRNQGGRAARFGRELRFGRSILVACNSEQTQRLLEIYLGSGDESLPPALAGRDLESIVCDLVASGVARSRDDVAKLLEGSYTASIHWAANLDNFRRDLDTAVEQAKNMDLLVEQPEGRLETTGLGRVVAVQGVRPATATMMARWVRELGARSPSPAEMLLVAALTIDSEDFPVPITGRDRSAPQYGAALTELIGEPAQSDDFLRQALDPPGGWTDERIAATKKAWFLCQWIGPAETEAIEEQSGLFSGTLANLAQHHQWLVQALGAAAEALGDRRDLVRDAGQLAERLYYGVEPDCLGLAALKVQTLTRGYLRALVDEGFDSIEAVAEGEADLLARWVPQRVAAELVERARYERRRREERREREKVDAASRRPGTRPKKRKSADASRSTRGEDAAATDGASRDTAMTGPALVFDESSPEKVWIDDKPILLTPYPYELLELLARNAARVVAYHEIDEALWPDVKVEPQQISAHKRAVVKGVAAVLGDVTARALVETLPRRGLRLNLAPENVVWKRVTDEQ